MSSSSGFFSSFLKVETAQYHFPLFASFTSTLTHSSPALYFSRSHFPRSSTLMEMDAFTKSGAFAWGAFTIRPSTNSISSFAITRLSELKFPRPLGLFVLLHALPEFVERDDHSIPGLRFRIHSPLLELVRSPADEPAE